MMVAGIEWMLAMIQQWRMEEEDEDIDMNIELEMTMQNQSWIIERDDGSMSAACFSRTRSSHYSHSITLTPSIVM